MNPRQLLRRFGVNAAWLYGAETLPRFVSLLVVAVWSKRVAPESYGIWLIAQASMELVLQASQLGFGVYLTKVLYRYHDQRAEEYFGFGGMTVMKTTVVAVAAMAAASHVLTRYLLGAEVRPDLFAWLAVYGVCAQFNNLAVQYLGSRVDYRSYFSLLMGRWAGNTGLLLVALLVFDQGFYSFVWAALGSEALLVPLAAYHMRAVRWRWRGRHLERFAWRFSLPQLTTDLLSWGEARVGRYVLAFAGLGTSVGLLGVAQNFSQVYGAAVRPAKIVAQRLVGHALEADAESPLYLEFFHLYSCVSLLCAFGLSLFLGDMVRMFTAKSYGGAIVALPVLLFTLYFQELYSLYHSLAFRYFKVWFHIWGTAIGFPVVAAATILMIAPFGFVGAALALLVGAIARALYAHWYCARVSHRQFRLVEKLAFATAAFGISQVAVVQELSLAARVAAAGLFTAVYLWVHWRRRHTVFPIASGMIRPSPSAAHAA